MRDTPTNSDDMIDPRDVEARIRDLEEDLDFLESPRDEALAAFAEAAGQAYADTPRETIERLELEELENAILEAERAITEWNDDNGGELRALRAFADEFSGLDGPLVRETYFETYAQEIADDIHGKAMRAASWPFSYIDWERAANALRMDYTGADFDGVTYYAR